MDHREAIYIALNMWANYIETGDVSLSIAKAIETDNSDKIRLLNDNQQLQVIQLRSLAFQIRKGKPLL